MAKQPDRWEQELNKNVMDADDWRACLIPAQRVLELLRKQHRDVVGIVRAEAKMCRQRIVASSIESAVHKAALCTWTSLDSILSKLNEMGK